VKEEWEFIEREVSAAYDDVFRNVKHGCLQCHYADKARLPAFDVLPPRIPARWLPHANFNHARHREVSCVVCHDPDFDNRDPRATSQLASAQTGDILLPSIAICRSCHATAPGESAPAATSDCIVCHKYHAAHTTSAGKLDDWLRERRRNASPEP
jgi:hypothetical protein